MRFVFSSALLSTLLAATAAMAQSSSFPAFPSQGKVELAPLASGEVPFTPNEVLSVVYGEKGDGEGYTLKDGRWAGYWFSQKFTLDGETYFTGFTADAPPEGEAPEGSEPTEPPIRIGHVTYKQSTDWNALSTAQGVGRIQPGGAGGDAPLIDERRKVEAVAPRKSRAVFAVPTLYSMQAGAQMSGYEIFAFDVNTGAWQFAGGVNAGYDNSAGCDDSGAMKCVTNTGAIAMIPTNPMSWGEWPIVRVTFSGTITDQSGAVRPATDADTIEWMFDTRSGAYAPRPKQ